MVKKDRPSSIMKSHLLDVWVQFADEGMIDDHTPYARHYVHVYEDEDGTNQMFLLESW